MMQRKINLSINYLNVLLQVLGLMNFGTSEELKQPVVLGR
ncbi:hypothetical protein NIES37_04400 [Tolypothrix tenuis PCC 7101]|uniref:Uncharacterized protein n=1 Tax=Tolypothrix tenuis PCC 7101 TaxID=231146 RepID=A0A1Z4MST4_9CYAN|nr:hypothetical protein NIES37_04400 [Tolypothrix tenuis PCC 7101]BAZ72987.1 hypothetical protein NIES50_15450 [Aulosira laxa NIES-50]